MTNSRMEEKKTLLANPRGEAGKRNTVNSDTGLAIIMFIARLIILFSSTVTSHSSF